MQTDRNLVVVPSQLRDDDKQQEPERFVDSQTAAKFLSVSKKWILLLARQGEIPAYPLGQGRQRSIWRFRLFGACQGNGRTNDLQEGKRHCCGEQARQAAL